MFILSASRRCDLPAFQLDAFLQRLRRGWIGVPHPFGAPPSRVPLRGPEVAGIVFWTRLPGRLLPHLDELLETYEGRLRVQISLTALPAEFETPAPAERAVRKQIAALAARLGPERLVWRYDPIVLGPRTPAAERLATFERLAGALAGQVDSVVVSWLDLYAKSRRNLAGLPHAVPGREERRRLLDGLAMAAAREGLRLTACCEPEMLEHPAVGQAHCLDGDWFERRLGLLPGALGTRPTRAGCACAVNRDVGVYDSCGFGCRYCYANRRPGGAVDRDPWRRAEAELARSGGQVRT